MTIFFPWFSVLDFCDLKISEIEPAATSTADYPAERIDASVTIDDNDFYLVATKETTFAALIEQVSPSSRRRRRRTDPVDVINRGWWW